MKRKNEGEHLPHSSESFLCFFRSFPTVAAEDAGGVGADSGADAARTERELLILPQLPRRGGDPGPRGNQKKRRPLFIELWGEEMSRKALWFLSHHNKQGCIHGSPRTRQSLLWTNTNEGGAANQPRGLDHRHEHLNLHVLQLHSKLVSL